MIKSIRAAIAAVRNWIVQEEKSVETILQGWFTAVSQLEQHAAAKAEAVLFHNRIAIKAGELAAAAEAEASKASAVAEKLKSVVLG